MALLTVVLTLALLSVIALAIMTTVLSSARAQAHLWTAARADALAEAAVIRAALALNDKRVNERWPVDGRAVSFAFDGVDMTVAIEDELGKIDVNNAGEAIIRALFLAAGQSEDQADLLARHVIVWRDEKKAGTSTQDMGDVRPRYGAFQSLDELRLVPGMTPDLFKVIAPVVTVYSQSPMIDPRTASTLALRAAQGLDEATAQSRIEDRQQAIDANRPSGVLPPNLLLAGRAVTVRVTIPLEGKTYRRQAVLRLTGDPQQPYWVLDWR